MSKSTGKSTEAKIQMLHSGVGPGGSEGPWKGHKDSVNRFSVGEQV